MAIRFPRKSICEDFGAYWQNDGAAVFMSVLKMMKLCGIFLLFMTCAIFALVAMINLERSSSITETKLARMDFQSLANGLKIYRMNAGSYPTTAQGLNALVEKPTTVPIPERWMKIFSKLPADPWRSPYHYRFPGTKDPTKFELSSDGPDQTAGTKDDVIYQEQ